MSSKITMVTLFDSNMTGFVPIVIPNKQKYCVKHGYKFVVIDHVIDDTRPASWSKLLAILECFKDPECEWVFWTDMDSVIMNSDIKLEDIISKYATPETNFMPNNDINGVNMGQMFMRNCQWSIDFIHDIYRQEKFIWDCCWEQTAARDLLSKNEEYRKRTTAPPQKEFNSYPHLGIYQKGDFILHMAGGLPNKVRMLEKFLLQAK